MARFVQMTSPKGDMVVWVNLDQVRYMRDSPNGDYTALKFDGDQSINVRGPASTIANKSGGS